MHVLDMCPAPSLGDCVITWIVSHNSYIYQAVSAIAIVLVVWLLHAAIRQMWCYLYPGPRVEHMNLTLAQLAEYNGIRNGERTLIALNGSIYDISGGLSDFGAIFAGHSFIYLPRSEDDDDLEQRLKEKFPLTGQLLDLQAPMQKLIAGMQPKNNGIKNAKNEGAEGRTTNKACVDKGNEDSNKMLAAEDFENPSTASSRHQLKTIAKVQLEETLAKKQAEQGNENVVDGAGVKLMRKLAKRIKCDPHKMIDCQGHHHFIRTDFKLKMHASDLLTIYEDEEEGLEEN